MHKVLVNVPCTDWTTIDMPYYRRVFFFGLQDRWPTYSTRDSICELRWLASGLKLPNCSCFAVDQFDKKLWLTESFTYERVHTDRQKRIFSDDTEQLVQQPGVKMQFLNMLGWHVVPVK